MVASAVDSVKRAMKTTLIFVAVCLASALASTATETGAAQDAGVTQAELLSKLPKFEVASIKLVDPGAPARQDVTVQPGGRVVIKGLPLKSLVGVAFNLSYWQISGGDAWAEKDEFNIEAKPSETAQSSMYNLRHSLFRIEDEQLRQMLQALLIERFQLKFHRKMKTGTVYILEKNGSKTLMLHPTEAPSSGQNPSAVNAWGSIGWAGNWVLFNTSMQQLAKFASDFRSPDMSLSFLRF